MDIYNKMKALFTTKNEALGSQDCVDKNEETHITLDGQGNILLTAGYRLCDRYEVGSSIGRGVYCQVVKAYDRKDKRMVAIKIIKQKYFNQAHSEIDILAILNKADLHNKHPIVRLKTNFIWNRHMCLVFELLSYDLYELIKKTEYEGTSLRNTQKIGLQILKALEFLSRPEINIIHGDIKPRNIVLCNHKKMDVKLIDFGISCKNTPEKPDLVQTRYYRSPEVMLGLPYDQGIDMWSLGCTLVELVTGLPLFRGANELDQMNEVVEVLGMPPVGMLDRSKKTNFFFYKSPNGYYKLIQSNKTRRHRPASRRLMDLLVETYEDNSGRELGSSGDSIVDLCNFQILIQRMLDYNTETRLKPHEALQHDFFKVHGDKERLRWWD